MAGLKIDPDGVSSYAGTLARSADQLDGAKDALVAVPLGAEAFGELGRQVRITEAYSRASSTLLDQLTRAVDTLNSASDALAGVAEKYTTSEQETAQQIKRAEQPR